MQVSGSGYSWGGRGNLEGAAKVVSHGLGGSTIPYLGVLIVRILLFRVA